MLIINHDAHTDASLLSRKVTSHTHTNTVNIDVIIYNREIDLHINDRTMTHIVS